MPPLRFSSRLLGAYRRSPTLVRKKAEFALLVSGLLAVLGTASVVAQVILGTETGPAVATLAGFALLWGLGLAALVRGRLEAHVNVLAFLCFCQCVLLLPAEVSRRFFTFTLFSMVVFAIVADRPYQNVFAFVAFPGLVVVKGLWEFYQASQSVLQRETRLETVLTLLVFLASIPLIRFLTTLVDREIHLRETLVGINQTLKKEAGTDRLTGTWNRRHFEPLLRRETSEAQRTGRPLALGFLDLDRFKQINDRWGHQAGDEVLAATVGAVAQVLRKGDSIVRWGGDEFVILCPGVGPEGAKALGEKLLEAVRNTALLRDRGLKVSLGMAVWKPGESPAALLERADKLLYQAKQEGRDRACLDPGASG